MGFVRPQCFGRCGATAIRTLADVAAGRIDRLTPRTVDHLNFWPDFLQTAKPRLVDISEEARQPALVFVDGSEEGAGEAVGVGAVLLTKDTKQAFGQVLPTAQVGHWKATSGRDRVIHQAELLPIAIALRTWCEKIKGQRVLLFIDNDAARYAVIKGTSENSAANEILQDIWELAAEWDISIWAERLPSKANPADGPSRGDYKWCHDNNVEIIDAIMK